MASLLTRLWYNDPRAVELLIKAADGHQDFHFRHERQYYGANYEEQAIGDGPIGRELERIRRRYVEAEMARGDFSASLEQEAATVLDALKIVEQQLRDEPLSLSPVRSSWGMTAQVAA